jgi:hypothetical protein
VGATVTCWICIQEVPGSDLGQVSARPGISLPHSCHGIGERAFSRSASLLRPISFHVVQPAYTTAARSIQLMDPLTAPALFIAANKEMVF